MQQNEAVALQVSGNLPSSSIQQKVDSIADDSLTNITWLGRMGVNNFMPVPLEKEKKAEVS